MASFGGAVGYTELRNMPIPELMDLHRHNARIIAERKAQMAR